MIPPLVNCILNDAVVKRLTITVSVHLAFTARVCQRYARPTFNLAAE